MTLTAATRGYCHKAVPSFFISKTYGIIIIVEIYFLTTYQYINITI